MMDEMAKTLARRRAACEKKPVEDDKKSNWEKTNTLPNNTKFSSAESPKSSRKRFGSASEETILKVNGMANEVQMGAFGTIGPGDLENLKDEILKDVRKEIQKSKQEIIEGKEKQWHF